MFTDLLFPSAPIVALSSAPLVRVLRVISPANPDLTLLLGGDVLTPNLLRVLFLVLANVTRIPQLGCNAQVLAAAHQRVRLATLAGGGDAVVVAEELAFAACLGDESVREGGKKGQKLASNLCCGETKE